MRLKKGDKVEVTNKDDTPIFWRAARILSSNGHTYRVQYDSFPGMVETVSRKFVRPMAPFVPGVESCVAGDIVEVFYECTWKMAAIVRVLEGKKKNKLSKKIVGVENQYLVRLLGCSREIVVGDSNMRMRQIWHGGKWVLIEKSSRGGDDVIMSNNPSTSIYHHKKNFQVPQINARAEKKPRNNLEEPVFFESGTIHSRSLKRMTPYGSSIIEAHNGHAKKLRAVEENGKKQREKVVDAVNIISNGHSRTESDDDECSVGSCSVNDWSLNNFCVPLIPFPCREETGDVCSDAESIYVPNSEKKRSFFPLEGELEGRIRRLELHAYRRTLEALYACGPLSWEQEALLTNLRIVLHISNDEHLVELKNLISAKTAINFRARVHHFLPRLKDDDARVCCLILLGITLWAINYSRLVTKLPFVATHWYKII